MKAFVSAAAVAVIAAFSSVSYAPPAHAARACWLILQHCPSGQEARCQEEYFECVANGGQSAVPRMPLKSNEE